MKKMLIIGLIAILLLVLGGCFLSKDPYFVSDKVKAEPAFLRPNVGQNSQLILYYTIKNPSNLDFSGKVSYKYNKDCLQLNEDETQVTVVIQKDNAYSATVSPHTDYRGQYKEECFGTQTILLALSNTDGTVVYDSRTIDISILR